MSDFPRCAIRTHTLTSGEVYRILNAVDARGMARATPPREDVLWRYRHYGMAEYRYICIDPRHHRGYFWLGRQPSAEYPVINIRTVRKIFSL